MDNKNTKTFAFVLGREKELALAELKAVLSRFGFCFDIYSITENIAFANIDGFTKSDAKKVIDTLGGTTKVFQVAGSRANRLDIQIADLIFSNNSTDSKLNFGISWYGINKAKDFFRFGLSIKKLLKAKGLSVRLVESKDAELSTILSTKNDLDGKGIEIGVFNSTIGTLLAVTNPYEWSKRDYDKPRADKRSGMVPPKLARMMVNLALDEQFKIQNLKFKDNSENLNSKLKIDNCDNYVVVDPFCGSGNILMEAMLLGCDVFGSDISEKAVEDSKVNLEWLKEKCQVTSAKYQVLKADATDEGSLIKNLELAIRNYDNFVVVAEPFLGEPKKFMPSMNAASGEYKKVKEIYLGFLKNISEQFIHLNAKPDGDNEIVLCMVFPLVETLDGKRYSLYGESVDEIRNLGYTQIRSFIYGRDYQVVKREIVLLKFKK